MRICFVCMGNICRSPTAEAVMRKLVRAAGLDGHVVLDSAGTGGWHAGELPDPRSRDAAAKRGYELDHRARQFTTADFDRFDLIIAMDRDNLAHLRTIARGRGDPPIHLLRAFEPGAPENAEVPDPYGGAGDDFDRVLDICERACRGLLEHVRGDADLS
ncbi:MAG TPA: low molecular weight protein-tyrosine-phosphatase [Kofleriaceae bacterium]|nr:low molecular weight protein-tyrosine-phosphatase [Kofleriaceae bacterium]